MITDHDRLSYLFLQYLQDKDSQEEKEELFAYIRDATEQAPLKKQITEVFQQVRDRVGLDEVDWDAMFSRIVNGSEREAEKPKMKIKRMYFWRGVAAAAIVLVLVGAGLEWYLNKGAVSPQIVQSQSNENDVMPGSNKATLTLANGSKIFLDSTDNGQLTSQGNANVVKINTGVLAYKIKAGQRGSGGDVAYNTLATPRGGQYKLILPDGTNVWLNAASSIRYPTVFSGKERKVAITGEAYFEVAKDAKMPFIVEKGDMQIRVLGTHFNVSAYADDMLEEVTLLEGSVNVSELSTRHSLVIRPGQQACVNKEGQIKLATHVNVADVIAWKNGFFSFHNDNLQSVMRKISRWYDVDVSYQPGLNNEQEFSGKIDRTLTLSQVLSGLEHTGAHFQIEANRKVKILP